MRTQEDREAKGRTMTRENGTAPAEERPRTPIERIGSGREGPETRWLVSSACSGLQQLETASVDIAVATPPGFWQRPATRPGAIGNEGSVEAYIERLGRVFDELARVLRRDATAWLAVGDSAYSGRGTGRETPGRPVFNRLLDRAGGLGRTVERKSLLGIPWRVAGALSARGWAVRATVYWVRPPLVPNTARDRPARMVEPVFLMARHRHYRYRAARWRSDPAADVWVIRTLGGNALRRDKLALVRRCLRLSDAGPGRTVIDPFAGAGETLAAAVERGAAGIGIDIDPAARTAAADTLAAGRSLPLDIDDEHENGHEGAGRTDRRRRQTRLAAAS